MLGWFLVYSEMIQLYIHMHNLFNIIFHYSLSQDIEYRSLCRVLLLISFIYRSLYLLIPNSSFIPTQPLLPLW